MSDKYKREDRKRAGDGAHEDDRPKDRDKRPRHDYRDRDIDRDRNRRDRSKERDRERRDRSRERDREGREREDRGRRDKKEEPSSAKDSLVAAISSAEVVENALLSKPEPVSVELLRQTQLKAQEEQKKPKFLTKAEREKLAMERRAAQVREQQQRAAAIMQSRESFFNGDSTATEDGENEDDRRRGDDRRGRDGDRYRDREEIETETGTEKGIGTEIGIEIVETEKGIGTEIEIETGIEEIRIETVVEGIVRAMSQYLGLKKPKKKVVKPSEKFKFVFSWDLSEDTSRDLNPLYNNRQEVRPAFGRGFIAGIDQREQLKHMQQEQDKTRISKLEKRLNDYLGKDSGQHWSEKKLEEMTQRDWRIFKEDYNIAVKGGGIPNPLRSWEESNLPEILLEAIRKAGYKEPSPIQRQAIPIGLQGRDLVGIAETGSGKTAAFVLPMLVYISGLPKMTPEIEAEGPYAVVLAPTRELALQIEQETQKFAGPMDIRTVSVVGGQPIEEQAFQLRKGCELVIATPGRLMDCLERRYTVLNQCNYVVLDEADRMIDMGFEQQVLEILEAMPAETLKSEDENEAAQQEGSVQYRRTTMFSATMPPAVERLSRKYLRRAAFITIGEVGKAAERIDQRVEIVKGESDKKKRIVDLLYSGIEPPIIIFVNQKKACDVLQRSLDKLGFRATVLHSSKSQEQREYAMEGFKSGKYDILVATDVASRGIDVKGVTHVINYDMAKNIEDYTHRIGRTGRAGSKGVAITFLTNDDADVMYDLKQMLISTGNPVPAELSKHPAAFAKPGAVPKSRRETVIYS
ncbi:DNA/RNA helicase, DEAD/DEAH box type, N-terminal [Balamuthia mandrillaris]